MPADAHPERMAGCPKQMVYGPCGGVRPSGACEVDATAACPFVDRGLRSWSGRRRPSTDLGTRVPLVVTDLHVTPRDAGSLRRVAAALQGSCDAVLVGDHGGARNDFAPAFMAQSLLGLGLRPWVTLSCRDRNRVALGAELAALAELGVAGVHCVTGDWQGLAGSGDEQKVFDLDCLRLVGDARDAGLTVSVAAAPSAPPEAMRPLRLAEKVAAGAEVCFVNHCGGTGPVARFVDEARRAGAGIPFLPCVAVTSDARALASLAVLPGVTVSREAVEASELPVADAERIAIDDALAMLAIPGVAGVNLSGSASSRSDVASAQIMATIGSSLRIRPGG